MINKKVLILGSKGMLGNYVYKYLNEKGFFPDTLNRPEFDAMNSKIKDLLNLEKIKNLKKGDILINCIGLLPHLFNDNSIANRGSDNENYQKYILINSILPNNLEKLKIIKSIEVINITSDCVFSGNRGNYKESDNPDYKWAYGITKAAGEGSLICNIRSSIIGEEKKSKRALLEWVKGNRNGSIKGFTNYFWNGVTCLEMSKYIEYIIKNEYFWEGVRHLYSPTTLSKYELVNLINKHFDLNITVKKYQLSKKIDRTLGSDFKLNYVIPEISDQIKEISKFDYE